MKALFKCLLIIVLVSAFTVFLKAQNRPPQPPSKNLAIVLPVEQWDIVLKALNELPYKEASPIINAIMAQAQTQLNPPPAKDTTQIKKK